MGAVTAVNPAQGDPSARRSPRILRALLRLVMPVTDLVVAVVGFTVCIVGLTVSLGTLPAFLLGLPLFVGFGFVSRWLASLERRRIQLFLGIEIPGVPGPVKGWRGQFTHAPTWRAIGYFLLQFLLGVVTFAVTVTVWATAGALLSMPWWLHHIPSRRADAGVFTLTDQRTAWILAGVGLLVAGIAALLTYGLTSLEGVASGLLAPDERPSCTRVWNAWWQRGPARPSRPMPRPRRLERDLHDGAQHRLAYIAMKLDRARSRLDDDPDRAASCSDGRTRRPSGDERAARPRPRHPPVGAHRPRA